MQFGPTMWRMEAVFRLRAMVAALVVTLLLTGIRAQAADPSGYTLTLRPTGDTQLDGALHDSSSLVSLREAAPAGPFALVTRAQEDVERFTTALHSFGYYQARVSITIDGRPLDDPGLVDRLSQAQAGSPVPVDVAFDLGPQFHLGRVSIDGQVPQDVAAKLDLPSGAPATAAAVLAAQARLLAALREQGYALAKVELPPATLHPNESLLDVSFQVFSGPQLDIGPITLSGLHDINEDFVRHRMRLQPGQRFTPEAIEQARSDLAALGVFSVVRAVPADQADAEGRLPLAIDVTERPLHAVDLSAGYSTDLGVNVGAGWHHRNLFGDAEQLNLTGAVQLGGTAVRKPGYVFGAQFIRPDFPARDQSLEIDLGAVKQSLDAYDQDAVTEKIAINRKLSSHWLVSAGLTGEQERIRQEGLASRYNLIGLPVTAKYDDTNNLLDPTTGMRGAFTITPTQSLTGGTATFFILQASGSTYFDLAGNGRSVLALRALVGQELGVVSQFSLPPDQRFYAGGSGTVRGYRYQSIGPQFPDDRPTGGTAVSAGSVEFRQRILDKYGVVAFVDAGQVTDRGAPFARDWRVGAGIGVRYYTSIGPLRLDVAVPLNRQPGGDAFELYIGIGQAF